MNHPNSNTWEILSVHGSGVVGRDSGCVEVTQQTRTRMRKKIKRNPQVMGHVMGHTDIRCLTRCEDQWNINFTRRAVGCWLSWVSCQMGDLERWLGQLHQMWMGGGKTGDWHPDKLVVC